MKEIGCFDDLLAYLDRVGRQYGFITGPGFPGWIIQAQTQLCDLVNMIENAVSYKMMIHYNRKDGTILAIGSRGYNYTYYNGKADFTHDLDYTLINPFTLSTIRCNTLADLLPHGSGIDADWHFTVTDRGSITAHNSYHAMDEYGGYWGWIDFSASLRIDPRYGIVRLVNVRNHADYIPSWLGGHRMQADYLHETIDSALSYNQTH